MQEQYFASIVARRVYSARQVEAMMADFWTNHFYVPGQLYLHADYTRTIRRLALGRFEDILLAAELHPAMLLSLSTASSTKEHPNENQAREVMELHTLGRGGGGYTEATVQTIAKLLTGWTVDSYEQAYDTSRHWTGTLRALGWSNANTSPDGREATRSFLKYLAHHPATADRICRKLAVRFVSDNPSDALVASLAKVYLDNDTQIKPVLRAIHRHSEFQSATGKKLRTPMEDCIGMIRATSTVVYPVSPIDVGNSAFLNLAWAPRAWPGSRCRAGRAQTGGPTWPPAWDGPSPRRVDAQVALDRRQPRRPHLRGCEADHRAGTPATPKPSVRRVRRPPLATTPRHGRERPPDAGGLCRHRLHDRHQREPQLGGPQRGLAAAAGDLLRLSRLAVEVMTMHNEQQAPVGCAEGERFRASRRGVLLGTSALMGGWVTTATFGGAFREIAYGATGDTIVLLNMGGGVDGLSWVVPHAESAYYGARPNIAVPRSALLGADATDGGACGRRARSACCTPLVSALPTARTSRRWRRGRRRRTLFSAHRVGWLNRLVGGTNSDGSPLQGRGVVNGTPPTELSGPAPVMSMSSIDAASVPGATRATRRSRRTVAARSWR